MSNAAPKSDAWVITLQTEGPGPPVEIRVRRFLKSALRCYGLRCVRVSENKTEEAGADGLAEMKTAEATRPGHVNR